jgi:uncharacterized delta-60 repeat protein
MHTQLKHIVWQGSLLAMVVAVLAFGFVRAEGEGPAFTGDDVEAQLASGSLDTTFAGDGVQVTNFGGADHAQDVAMQSDGKIVVAGSKGFDARPPVDFALVRYNPNGSLDTTFSGDGKLLTDFGGDDTAYDVAIQPDGKIVVSGVTRVPKQTSISNDLAVARYNSDGTLDTTFDGDGKQTVDFGLDDVWGNGSHGGLAIRSDGKIIIGGYIRNNQSLDFAVYRLNSDGSLDETFGGTGVVSIDFRAGNYDVASDLLLQNGKIVVGGYTCSSGFNPCDFALARLTPNGALDTTFSGDGRQTTNFGSDYDYGAALAKQSDGKILLVGSKHPTWIAIARYNSDGSLDPTFNGTGKKSIRFGEWAGGSAVQVRGNGKIVIAGTAFASGNQDFALVRLHSDGSLDTTFSGDGKARYTNGTNSDSAAALVIQADGKYVLAGVTEVDTSHSDFAVLRILP